MSLATLSSKFQIVIPRDVRERLHLRPRQKFQVIDRAGMIALVADVPLKSLRGICRGADRSGVRDKSDRV